MEKTKSTWGGVREGQGRPKGSKNKTPAQGRKTVFKTVSISGTPEEVDKLKQLALDAGYKSFSRFVIESLLK